MKGYYFKVLSLLFLFPILFYSCEKEKENDDPVDPDPTFENCGTVTDIDGNTYSTIKIGSQCWMRENLKVTHYRNGDPIPTTATPDASIMDEEIPKYQWVLEGEDENLNTYGRIYTWYVTTDERKICPEGWHMPSDNEWKDLEIELGMTVDEAEEEGARGAYIGSLIAGDAGLWTNPHSILVINEYFALSGFDGLPGGARNGGGAPVSPGYSTYWWTSTAGAHSQYDSSSFFRYINYESTQITRGHGINQFGFYVRCVRD